MDSQKNNPNKLIYSISGNILPQYLDNTIIQMNSPSTNLYA